LTFRDFIGNVEKVILIPYTLTSGIPVPVSQMIEYSLSRGGRSP